MVDRPVPRVASRAVRGSLVAALAVSWLAGCSNNPDGSYDYAQVCRDQHTGNRLPDADCQPGHHGSGGIVPVWYWVRLSGSGTTRVPGVGERISGDGSVSRPATGRVATGVDGHGTSVSHGGFGEGGHAGSVGE